MLKRSKKGNAVLDTVMVVIVLFSFALLSIIGYKVFTDVNTDLQSSDTLSSEAKVVLDDLHTKHPSMFDGFFLVIMILLWVAVIVASFMIDSHPIFLVVTVLLTVFILFLGAVFSNTFESLADSEELASSTANFPITYYLMTHLYIVVLVFATTISLVLFAKVRG